MSEEQNNMADFQDDVVSEKARYAKKTSMRLIKQLLEQKWKLLLVFISILFASAFTILAPKAVGAAINQIFDGIQHALKNGGRFIIDWDSLGMVITILLSLYLMSSLFNYMQQYIMASVSQTLTLSLRKKISEKLNRLPIKYFDTHSRGDILSRATSDLERVSDSLQEGLTQFFSSFIGILGAFTMMLFISVQLTVIVLLTIAVSILISLFLSRYTQSAYSRNQKALGNLNGSIEESFTGNNIIKSFNLEKAVIDKTEELSEELYEAGKRAQFITYVINPIIRLFNQLGYVIIAIRGAISVISGSITLGDIQAFFQYVNQVTEPVTEMAYVLNMFQGAVASAERVYEFLDTEEEADECGLAELPDHVQGNIRFKNVSFGYTKDKLLMKGINLDIQAGSKVAIVGPTGAGKTTLVNLLMRFYELNSGQILMDDTDIASVTRTSLRSKIGMVLQDTWLFEGSIKDNISYGKEDAAESDMIKASRASRVDHFIRTMSEGYHTMLDAEASNISQGQKQLLTIARVVLANPNILILDEATSNVDTRTEIEIQKAMNALMSGRTTFIIAHRLSTIRDADKILVMRDGDIIEQGTHDELMDKAAFYADLYNSQFAKT